jgi:hypothetical protein
MLAAPKSVSEFDIRSISGCTLWLDASKDTTPTGSSVTILRDQSGNGYDLKPLNDYNSITLATEGPQNQRVYNFGYARATHPNFHWDTNFTQFVVVRSKGYGSWFVTNGSGEIGYENYVLSGNWDLMYVGQTFGAVDAEVLHTSIFNLTPQGINGWQLFCIGYSSGSSTVVNYSLNGVTRNLSGWGNPCTVLQNSYPLWINGRWDYPNDDSLVAEFIHFNASLTSEERQQVEGYLAWKWGLNQTPGLIKVPALLPSLGTGCVLWLDGADKSTMVNGLKPLSYFPFDNSIVDLSNVITLRQNGSVPYVTGKYGQAVSFTNATGQYSSNYLSTSYSLPPTFTVAFWFQTPSASPNAQIFCTAPNSGYSYGGICAYLANGNLYHAYSHIQNGGVVGAISPNTWYHVSLTYNNGTCLAYLNGSLGGNPVSAGGSSINGFTIGGGADYGFDPYPFTGFVDDLRIYTSVLTAEQISILYTTTPTNSAVTSWLDKSGNNNTALNVNSSALSTDKGVHLNGNGYFTVNGLVNSLVNTPFVLFIIETVESMSGSPALFGDNVTTGGLDGGLHVLYINESFFLQGFYGDDIYYYNLSGTGAMRLWTVYLPTSSNRVLRLNGSVVKTHNTANRLNAFQQPVIGRNFGSHNYTGTFSEIILYTVDLGVSSIEQIEKYLLQKWKMMSIPTVINAVPSPLQVRTCTLWLDGADASSILLSGSAVQTWKDKSGHKYDATVGSNSSSVLKTSSGLSFDGAGFMSIPGLATLLVNTPFVIFIVETATSTSDSFFFGDNVDHGINGATLHLGYRSPTDMTFALWNNDLENYTVAGTNSTRVWCFYLPTSSNRVIRRNGVVDATHTNYDRLSQFVTPVIGRFSTSFYKGTLSEVIVFASDPGLSAIQSIESYLLNKWGRAGVNKLVPASIPGMALWLDGTDVAGTGYSAAEGSVFSVWADKSGNNAHGTAISGTPSYDALTQSVVFDGNLIFQFPNGTITPGSSTFTIFLVCKPTSLDYWPYVYKAGSPGYDTCTALIFYANGAIENGFYTDYMTVAPGGSVRVDQSYIFTSAFDGTTRTLYRNGTSVVTGTIAGTKNVTSSENYLGGGGNTVNFKGTMSEFIVFNRTLSSSDRESVELYLTSKWKIPRGDLSRGPIASAPGCWLWLDGADPLGTDEAPQSGTTITKWVDKSGNGRSATTNSGNPSYESNALNGCSALVFSSTSLLVPEAELSPNNTLSTFVVFSTNENNRGGNNDFLVTSTVSYSTFDLSIDQLSGIFLLYNGTYTSLLSNIANRPILLSIISDSSTVKVYKNGNLLTSTSIGQTYPFSVVTGWSVGTNFSGCLAEIVMFNSSLSTSQQQSIESYLAVKWGFASLPFIPSLSYPTLIPGCRMWLDGSDPNGDATKFANGEEVSSWFDKSGYGNNATPSSGRIAGTFSTASNCVYFQSSNVGYRTNYTATPQSETMFLVVNIKSPSSINNNTLIGGAVNARSIGIGWNGGINTTCSYLRNEVAWEQSTPSQSFAAGDIALVTGQVSNSGSTLSIAVNGSSFSTGSGFGAFGSPATTTYLGVDTSSTSYYYIGYVMEIIFYNSLLTLEQRQFVERYLTQKWGITKTFYEEIPGQIPGCQLWLDSKDTSTLFSDYNASSLVHQEDEVFVWKDKSGHGRNYTMYQNAPIYEGADGGSVTFYRTQSMVNSDSWTSHGSGVDIFLVSTPWDSTEYNDWRTLFRGNSAGHRVILWHNGQQMGFYNNNGYGFCQFGSLTQGNSKSLIYVRTDESFFSSAAINGSPLQSAGGVQDYDTQPFYFLGGYGAYQNWGAINEVLIFSNVTSAQRETIEAYLAKKWNLTTPKQMLPLEHPYSSLKPLGRVLTPVDIPSCQLWLDASDTRTVLSENTIVNASQNFSVWNDKSGNARNMSVVDGTVVYTNHSIVCSGSGYLRVDSPVDLTSFTVFIVVTPNPNYQNQTVFSAIPYSGGEAYYSLDGFDFFLDGSVSSRFYAGGSALGVNSTNNQPQTTGPKLFTYVTDGYSL